VRRLQAGRPRTRVVRFLARARVSFLSKASRTGSGAHPAFNAMATGGSFPGDKEAGK